MPAVIRSEAMTSVLSTVERVAGVNAALLITGESGVGKELIARATHHFSPHAGNAWVDVSCGALPEHLVESELFGYEKGAFSSAEAPKPGLFELADDGTLFLDEVGELEPRMQVKLLRVLDGVPYYRLGGTNKIDVKVRVVAATNRDLGEMVSAGRFRADLYHRLSQIQIDVPPLRHRITDILPLAEYFIADIGVSATLSPEARDALVAYDWPGNVRELRNVIVKAAVLSPTGEIVAADLPRPAPAENKNDLCNLAAAVSVPSNGNGHGQAETDWSLEGMERRLIEKVLSRTGGHQQQAAELLGISRRTLSRKLKAYNVEGYV
jgi:transcriptional regulator with PAS, ATPase and Fis domain